METSYPPSTTLRGPWLLAARLAWILLAVLSLSLLFAAVPSRYEQLLTVSPQAETRVGQLLPEDASVLDDLGLSPSTYAWYFTALEVVSALPFVVVGGLVFLRRSDDWIALLNSITGILWSSVGVPVVSALLVTHPQWSILAAALRNLSILGLISIFYLFPDGRFRPRWTRWLLLVWMLYSVVAVAYPRVGPPPGIASIAVDDIPVILWTLGFMGTGVLAQVWRYRHVSTPFQRQQTKWPLYGLSLAFLLIIAATLPNLLIPSLREPGVASMVTRFLAVTVTLLVTLPLFPITIAFAILRYRLWDIDLLINRTLVYGSLTGTLAILYFGSVVFLQQAFRAFTGQASNLAVVITTLVLAAAFNPLRARIQDGIDRRFYRRKYDAEKALAELGAAFRAETDLEVLTDQLLFVVRESMQPTHVSLWLRSVDRGT